jgi:hypothetical protein
VRQHRCNNALLHKNNGEEGRTGARRRLLIRVWHHAAACWVGRKRWAGRRRVVRTVTVVYWPCGLHLPYHIQRTTCFVAVVVEWATAAGHDG